MNAAVTDGVTEAITDLAELQALVRDPATAARRACERRTRAFGRQIWIRPATDLSPETAWPDASDLGSARITLRVEHDQLAAYFAWLQRAAAAAPTFTLAPWCPTAGGLFRLHLIAAARLALPLPVRVEVRHDLHGVRLAQVALGFGADTLAGPIDAGRHLPLAGVPRPSETSEAALSELVRQAGLEPITHRPQP